MTSTVRRVLLAPDSFKGSIGAADAAAALAAGWRSAAPDDDLVEVPLSDGGEGLVEVFAARFGGERRSATVADPLGRPVDARYLVVPDGTAVLESAEPIGLTRLTERERDPLTASSAGLGELIAAAASTKDVRRIVLGVGGVATVDGGAGLRSVLAGLPVPVTVVCDVRNPLLGPRGAAAVFGPQKGATPQTIPVLEARLAALGLPEAITSRQGAGAAGGLGAMLAAMGAELVPGIEYVLRRIGWTDLLRGAELVITGEGTVDWSTADGKVVAGVVEASASVPVIVIGGRVEPDGAALLPRPPVVEVLALGGTVATAKADLTRMGRRLATAPPRDGAVRSGRPA